MKEYKVIALSVGSRNRIHRDGDIVKETTFRPGEADELVKNGFLELIEEDDDEFTDKKEGSENDNLPPSDKKDGEDDDQDDETEIGDKKPPVDDVTPPTADEITDKKEGDLNTGNPESDEKKEGEESDDVQNISKNQLKKQLKEAGIEFSNSDSKEELYRKLINA